MALLTALPLDAARELGRAYGIELSELFPLTLGSVNSNFRAVAADGRVFFARLYEEQGPGGARSELELLHALARAGSKVAEPLARTGALPLYAGKPFALFPWLEGELLCFGRVSAETCRRVGSALARVHLASSAIPRLGPGRFGPPDMLARLERVERETTRAELLVDVRRARELYGKFVPARDASLPSGIVHGDLFRDNVLWRDGEILALLDFESVFHGPFIYDLCVTIAAWCYGDAFDVAHARAMVEGYGAARPLSAAERAAVPVEGALACLRFLTSRITDFELRAPPGSPPVRDFRRFFARLTAITSGVLAPAFAP